MISLSEVESSLVLILETHLFGALAAVKFDERGAAAATVAWMVSLAELVELSNHILQVLRVVVSEDH